MRVRIERDIATLTVKGLTIGATHNEYIFPISISDALELLKLCDGPVLEKNRYAVFCNSVCWEVDEFLGENEGLIVAEVELKSEGQSFERPEWIGQEVTKDPRYFNSNLCSHPYCKW